MIHTRVVQLDGSGAGSISVAPSRLAALLNGSLTNLGTTYAAGKRLPGEEEFISGDCVIAGDPETVCRVYLLYPGH